MKNNWRSLYLLLSIIALVIIAGCNSSQEKPVKTEESEPVEQNENRIIAGTVVIAEILDKLDIDAIAIPETEKALASRFEGLPTIGNAMSPDMEIVKSMKPTDFLSVSTLEYDLTDTFQQLNIPTSFLNFQSVDAMLGEIKKLGERYDRTEKAEELIASLQQSMEDVKAEVSDKEAAPPRVLVLLGIPGSYLVATEHSYIGDLVKRAGGINVMAGQDAEYLSSNTEYLYDSNPDIILRLSHGMPEEVVKMFNEDFKTNDVWKHFNAVKNGKVYDLEEETFGTTASLQVPKALHELVEIFYR